MYTEAHTSQANQEKSQYNKRFSRCYTQFFMMEESMLASIVEQLPNDQLLVMDQFMYWSFVFSDIRICQERIARFVGMSRQRVNYIIKQLCQKGLIQSRYRGFKKTCLYTINHYFFYPSIKERLQHTLSWIKRGYHIALKKLRPRRVMTQERQEYKTLLKKEYVYRRHGEGLWFKERSDYEMELLMKQSHVIIREMLKHIPLTAVGICKLSVLDESLLEYVWKRVYLDKERIQRPYQYIMKAVLKLMKDSGIEPRWGLADDLITALGKERDDAPYLYDGWRDTPLAEPTVVTKPDEQTQERIRKKQEQYLQILGLQI